MANAPADEYRVLVCGGRDFHDRDAVFAELDRLYERADPLPFRVVHGGAAGADSLAGAWAREHEDDPRVLETMVFRADWERHGKSAGPRRNTTMLRASRPSGVLAFWDGKVQGSGTYDMMMKAVHAGVRVLIVPW